MPKKLEVGIMKRGMTWLDAGTVDSMNDATEFIRLIEKRTNKKIACIEEIAYNQGFINKSQALSLSKRYGNSSYANYIRQIVL